MSRAKMRRNLLGKPGKGELRLEQLLLARGEDIVPQYEALGYFIDFALPDEQIAIEVDPKRRYSAAGNLKRRDDVVRQVKLEREGWRFVRVLNHKVEEVFTKLKTVRSGVYIPLSNFVKPVPETKAKTEVYGPAHKPLVRIRRA